MAINNGIHDKFNKRKVGFSSASSYSKTFKNYVDMTPTSTDTVIDMKIY